MHKNFGIITRLSASLSLAFLAGCSIAGFGPDVDQVATKSIIQYDPARALPLQETVDPSDWEKVRAIMAMALISQPPGEPLPWENDVTGTVGSIVVSDAQSNADGRFCRTFSTTLNGIGGVSQYRGDACKQGNGEVKLVGLAPHNAVVQAITPAAEKKVN